MSPPPGHDHGNGNGEMADVEIDNDASAPWYDIPRSNVISLDHPGIIKNLSNAVRTLGGPEKLNQVRDPSIGRLG
jgi:hypothetical protein